MSTSPRPQTEGTRAGPSRPHRPGPSPTGLLLVLPALLFSLITWQVTDDGPLVDVDERLSRALVHPDGASELMSDLGNVQIAIPVIVLTAGYTAWRGSAARVRRWWLPPVAALLLMTLVPLIVIPLKAWTDRVGTPTVPPATGYYPSGHTATAVVAYGAAALLLLPWLLTDLARRAVLATAAVLVAAASFGLVRRGYHWPLDVVASWCLGALLLGALWLTLRRIARGATAPIRHTPAHHHYDSDKRPPARPPLPWTRKPTHTPNAEGPGTRS